jgi:hypothetical protein
MVRKRDEVTSESRRDRLTKRGNEESKYPHTDVEITAGGTTRIEHREKNNESLEVYHISGNFEIIYPDGTKVMASPSEVKVEHGAHAVTVKNNMDLNVGGHLKQQAEGGLWLETAGTTTIYSKGDTVVNSLENVSVAAKGNALIMADGNLNIDAKKDFNVRAGGDFSVNSDGAMVIDTKAGIKMQATRIDINEKDGAPGEGYNRNRVS